MTYVKFKKEDTMSTFRLTLKLRDKSVLEFTGTEMKQLFIDYANLYKDDIVGFDMVEISDNQVLKHYTTYDSVAAIVYEQSLHEVVEIITSTDLEDVKINRLFAMFGL